MKTASAVLIRGACDPTVSCAFQVRLMPGRPLRQAPPHKDIIESDVPMAWRMATSSFNRISHLQDNAMNIQLM